MNRHLFLPSIIKTWYNQPMDYYVFMRCNPSSSGKNRSIRRLGYPMGSLRLKAEPAGK